MFLVNEDKSIYVTRGDVGILSVIAKIDGNTYLFKPGDVVRLKVVQKKAYDNVALQKDVSVTVETERVDIFLSEADTKIGDVISKPTDYWYEVELNPFTNPQTIIGYDEDGAKIFKLFPEGRDLVDDITEEDIPVVDTELSLTSEKPVQNQAISRAITNLNTDIEVVKGKIAEERSKREVAEIEQENFNNNITATIEFEQTRIDNLVTSATVDSEVIDIRVGEDGVTYSSAGTSVREQFKAVKSSISTLQGEKAPGIVNTASGSPLVLKDSANAPLQNLKLFGKTTQNGTPTPEAPVPLVSVGDSGSFTVKIQGENVEEQTLTMPYNPLRIPVLVDYNYIDANGQKYIRDEIDLNKGIFNSRIIKIVLNGSEAYTLNSNGVIRGVLSGVKGNWANYLALSTHFNYNATMVNTNEKAGYFAIDGGGGIHFTTEFTTVEEFKTWLQSNNVIIYAVRTTPQEIPLTETELNAYRQLMTNKGTTTVLSEADMQLDYIADTKTYIDNKFAELSALILEV